LVVREAGVGKLLRASRGGSLNERAASRIIPGLRGRRLRERHNHEQRTRGAAQTARHEESTHD
jgi:hypothetical protein